MRKLILLGALVLSSCGYYTAPRDKRFIDELYVGMPVAELEALVGAYRGIKLFYPTYDPTSTHYLPENFCIRDYNPCYPETLANDLHFERPEPIYDQNGQVISIDHRLNSLLEPTVIIQMGGHRIYPPINHQITAYYNPTSRFIIGFKESSFWEGLSTHFPINIR